MAQTELPRQDVSVAIETRRELGEELEPQVIDSFLERVGKAIDERVDESLAKRTGGSTNPQLSVAVFSLLFGIPLTGIGAGTTGLAGLVVVWVGIVLVNFAFALRRR
jgi:hypothetical protein